jgi:hypothetical protein
VDDAKQRHFGSLERHRRGVDFGKALDQQLPQAMDGGEGEPARPAGERLPLLGGLGAVVGAADLCAGDGVDAFEKAAQHRRRFNAEVVLRLERVERAARLAGEEKSEQLADRAAIGEAEHRPDLVGADSAGAVGDRLVEDREAVARRPFRRPGDQRQRLGLRPRRLLRRRPRRNGGELLGGNAAKVEALAAREHRHRHLVHLGGGEQELHMRRRLLERLQERVERVLGQHVDFVDDVDLVARRDGRIAHRLDDLAHVVDAGVAGGVHLDDVDVAPLGYGHTRFTPTSRDRWWAALPVRADAVQRLGDEPRGRRLADAAHPGEQKGVSEAVALDRVAEGADHRVLPDQLREALGAIFAGEDPVGLRLRRLGRLVEARARPKPEESSGDWGDSETIGATLTVRAEPVEAQPFNSGGGRRKALRQAQG